MIALTGATGQLGRLVIERLLKSTPPAEIVAAVRSPAKAADLAAHGVLVRRADYNDPASLDQAFAGVDRLLLISSSEVGRRGAQHRQVSEAAQRRKVKLIAYTSLLRADTSPLNLAGEHRETEAMLKTSGTPFVILRNGWYTENYTGRIPGAIAQGALYGSAGNGRISSAARADYADAAAAVLTGKAPAGTTYELAGDTSYTLADLAAEISRQTGKTVPYRDLPEADFRGALLKAGLPEWLAAGVPSWDVGASQGALLDNSHQLQELIGRPTTPMAATVKQSLRG